MEGSINAVDSVLESVLSLEIPDVDALDTRSIYERCFTKESYNEFLEAIGYIDSATRVDKMYLESVEDKEVKKKGRIKTTISNTVDVAQKTGQMKNDIVDTKATVYKGEFDIVYKIGHAILKVIIGIVSIIINGIKGIGRLLKFIVHLPKNIISKIKGDLHIYITVNDLGTLYNEGLIRKLDKILDYIDALTKNPDKWKSHWVRPDDGTKLKKMHAMVTNIQNIEFTPSTIKMNDQHNVETYLYSETKIEFIDKKGNAFSGSYLEALQQLLEDLQDRQGIFNQVKDIYDDKRQNTEENQNFGKLGVKDQNLIVQGTKDISIVMNLIGKITNYVMHDINEISKAAQKVDQYTAKNMKREARKDAKRELKNERQHQKAELQRQQAELGAGGFKEVSNKEKRDVSRGNV